MSAIEVTIRPISIAKGGNIKWDVNSKFGYQFVPLDVATPKLTELSLAIIPELEATNTLPLACYLGSMMVRLGYASWNVKHIEKDAVLEDFKQGFDSKKLKTKHYYYKSVRADDVPMPVETFFVGVRVIAYLVYCYHEAKKQGQLNLAKSLNNKLFVVYGITGCLIHPSSKQDDIYNLAISKSQGFFVQSRKVRLDTINTE